MKRRYVDARKLFEELKVDYLSYQDELQRYGLEIPLVPGDKVPLDVAAKLREKFPRITARPRIRVIKKAHPSPDIESIALALFGKTIRVVSLSSDGTYRFIDGTRKLHNILYITSSETAALRLEIEELEHLVNDPRSKERDFQAFFQKHPDLIKSDEYSKVHSQIILTKGERETFIPDFVLEPVNQKLLCDILELKLPSTRIFTLKERRMRFSSAVYEAVAQLREYSIFFDEAKNREKVYQEYGFSAFKPKMFVIIGRRGDLSPIDVRKMEMDIPGITLRTYDDIADKARARLDAMRTGRYRLR